MKEKRYILDDDEEVEYGFWHRMHFENIDFSKGKTIIKVKYVVTETGEYRITLKDGWFDDQNNKYTSSLSMKINK